MTILGPTIESIMPTRPVATPADGVSEDSAAAADPVVVHRAPPPTPAKPSYLDMRTLQKAIAHQLEEYLRESGRSLEFRVDDSAKATVITIRRSDTGEVVRQYPTEEALALLRRLNERSGTLLEAFA